MEALEELAVSYERQDGEIEASNQEKASLQCEVERLQVAINTEFCDCIINSLLDIFIILIFHSTVRGTGEDAAVLGHSGGI